MDPKDLRKKDQKELTKLLQKAKEDMENLAKEILKGKEKNVAKLRALKKDCARIRTVLNEKKILEEVRAFSMETQNA